MSIQKKIQNVSFWLKTITVILLFALPLMNASFWILNGFPYLEGCRISLLPQSIEEIMPSMHQLPPFVKLIGFFVTMIPVGLTIYALWVLRELFCKYERLEIFSKNCVGHIRMLGLILLVSQLLYPLYLGMLSVSLTFNNPPGDRMLMIGFGTTQFLLLFISIVIFLISWIMDEGRKMKEEQDATI